MTKLKDIYKGEYGTDFYLRIAKKEMSGFMSYNVFGYKQGISATVLDDISQIPSTIVIPTPNGIQLRAVSSSANDISITGTGIRALDLHFLDTNYDVQSEIIIMNGLTPVNTVAANIQRVLWMHALTVGSAGGVAAGNISLTNTAGTVTYEYITAGGNRSLSSHFTIPDGKIGFILEWQASAVKQDMSVRLRATAHFHDNPTLLPGVFIFHDLMVLKDGSLYVPKKIPLIFPARCDIKVSAVAGTANGDCGVGYSILLIDD